MNYMDERVMVLINGYLEIGYENADGDRDASWFDDVMSAV